MKKYIIIFVAAIAMVMTSCNNDVDEGSTATQATAGRWTVSWEYNDGTGWQDVLGEKVPVYTYNTAANVDSLMWLKDANCLSALTTLHANVDKLTFYSGVATSLGSSAEINKLEGSTSVTYKVINGAIFKGAAKTPSGLAADSIRYYVVCGTDTFKVAGFRYTGFPADEE
jgi:hypothetical protein